MIIDLNKQRITSDFIELFKINTPAGWLCFTNYHIAVYFRDRESPYDNREYIPLPVEFSGFEQKSEGAYSRPRLSVANILTTFSNALDDFTNDDLIGYQVVRRKTLAKYLDNSLGTAFGAPAAPKELPQQIFYIDRIERMDATSVSFELASPFDLAGIMMPARNIVPNTCPWPYQGAADDTPYATPTGGCVWKLAANNNGVTAYFDERNSLFTTHTITATTGTAVGDFYRISKSLRRVNIDRTISTITGYDYWQARVASATTPAQAHRRVRTYSTYNAGTNYFTFLEGEIYNSVVLHNSTLWVCIRSCVGQTPALGSKYWKRADKCGKKLSSCASRFASKALTNATGATVDIAEDKEKVLYYGAFPASRRYNFTG